MKRGFIFIYLILLSILLVGCKVETNTTQQTYENYIVNFKQLRFYVIEIMGSAPNCDDRLPVESNKSTEVYLTGADLHVSPSSSLVSGARYCYSQRYLYLDLSLYENNSYYINDLTLTIEAYNINKTFHIDKNFIFEKSDMIYESHYAFDGEDGFDDRIGDTFNPINANENEYFLKTTFLYKDFPSYYYDETKSNQHAPDQFYFNHPQLESLYYKQYYKGELGYDGFLYTYLVGNTFNELIYPTTLIFQDGDTTYQFNDGVFYIVIDLRDKE